MKIIAFRDNEKYYHMIHKLKKMEQFTKDLRACLEDKEEDDEDFDISERRGGMSRREREDDDDVEIVHRKGGRYSY